MKGIQSICLLGFISLALMAKAPADACTPQEKKSAIIKYEGEEVVVTYDSVMEVLMSSKRLSSQPWEIGYSIALEQRCLDAILGIAAKKRKSAIVNDEKFKKMRERMMKELERTFLMQMLVNKKVTDAAVKKEYNDLKNSFEKNNKYVYHLSLIIVDSLETANTVGQKIKQGNDFESLAEQYSIEEELRKKKGLVETPIPDGQMVEGMRTVAESLVDGGVSSSFIRSGKHFVFIKKRRRDPAVMPPLDKIRDEVVSSLESKILPEVIESLIGSAKVDAFDARGEPLKINLSEDLKAAMSGKMPTSAAPAA